MWTESGVDVDRVRGRYGPSPGSMWTESGVDGPSPGSMWTESGRSDLRPATEAEIEDASFTCYVMRDGSLCMLHACLRVCSITCACNKTAAVRWLHLCWLHCSMASVVGRDVEEYPDPRTAAAPLSETAASLRKCAWSI